MRSRYAGRRFTTSTADIAAALEDVSIPTLLLSLVHITGDPWFIRDFKPMGIFLNEVQDQGQVVVGHVFAGGPVHHFPNEFEAQRLRLRATAVLIVSDHR